MSYRIFCVVLLLLYLSVSFLEPNLVGADNQEQSMRPAIAKVLSFSGDDHDVIEVGKAIQEDMGAHIPQLIRERLGEDNLSSFMFLSDPGILEKHKIELYPFDPMSHINKLGGKMRSGNSIVAIGSVHDVRWEESILRADCVEGSFRVDENGFFKADFRFIARKIDSEWKISRLSIPPIDPNDDELVVFEKSLPFPSN